VEELLTAKELAQILKLKLSTIYAWTHTGMIPHIKISRNCIRFRLSDVLAWLEERTVKGRPSLRPAEYRR
jgi:excisionase family DNA binding protein